VPQNCIPHLAPQLRGIALWLAALWRGPEVMDRLLGEMVSSVAQNMQCRQFSQKQLMFWKVTVETYPRFRPQNKSPKHAAWF